MLQGAELDAEIARKIFGIVVLLDTQSNSYLCKDTGTNKLVPVPSYSSDSKLAYQIVQLYKKAGCTFSITANDNGSWTVVMTHPKTLGINFSITTNSLPSAICQCVLQFSALFKIS